MTLLTKAKAVTAAAALMLGGGLAAPAQAQIIDYTGNIITVAFDFCPRGTLRTDSQLLSINSNQSLYALLGLSYGGNGVQTFGLPDLRGRVSMGWGDGPGLTPNVLGAQAGFTTVTLSQSNLPPHSHTVNATNEAGTLDDPTGAFLGRLAGAYHDGPASSTMDPAMLSIAGATGNPVNNTMPYTTLTNCIVTQGIFPPRN
ncbi:phage tail protein [Tropicibacter naphthalenivorans]|uniref:Phage Tail Collar Domain protein n=1 Tax=Tropicibacter naphthalenivorans TaxID=441103 RepID=A0A0P1G4D3_9RHOB|nr:tail fiber protein [Tropicibacter naphthalenivorans]CUH76539.1 Phage Tail Collar Domain protein [Tropicibacter naphthalenivorans]SMC65502.1 Microcystin-dependent protein [Tropicibacter naphthalenivorans]